MFLNRNLSDISNKQTLQQHKIKNIDQAPMKHCKTGTAEPYIMKYESMSTIYKWSSAPGLVSRKARPNPGGRIVGKMVFQLLHYYALCYPTNLFIW